MEVLAGIAGIIGIITGIWFLIDKARSFSKEPKWRIQDKVVNSNWLETSRIKNIWEQKGFTLVWINSKDAEEYLLKGYVYAFEENPEKLIRFKLVRTGQVLCAKPNT